MTSAQVAASPTHTSTARVNRRKADWRGWKFMWPFAVVFVFVFIVPIVYAVYISFFSEEDDWWERVRWCGELRSFVW